jgi:hypothetical protein
MADTHDTIDGLLAEFRGYSAGMPPSYHVTMSWADFRKMLDRFDAAHKRERGDCAKLREVVDAMMYEAFALCDSCVKPAAERGKLLAKWCNKLRAALAATAQEGGAK